MRSKSKTFYRKSMDLFKGRCRYWRRRLPEFGCRLRKALTIKNLCKVVYLYVAIIFLIIIWQFELPCNLLGDNKVIALYGVSNRVGEKLLYDRIRIVAKNLGWKVVGTCVNDFVAVLPVIKHFYYAAASLVNLIYKPKFNLSVTHSIHFIPYGYNVVYLNVPSEMLFDLNGDFKKEVQHLSEYNAYADLYSLVHGKNTLLDRALKKYSKTTPIIPVYLAQNYIEYTPVEYKQSLITGSLWGCNRKSLRVNSALQKLVQEDLLVAYGIKNALESLGSAYKDSVEKYDDKASPIDNLINIHKKYGIALIIHNLDHTIEQLPTSRISEAIAAGAIVISDEHGFVKKHFGDNVLYFNSLTGADEMYSQINKQMEWIKNNQALAENKARAAHKILMDNFSLEIQLQKLDNHIAASH